MPIETIIKKNKKKLGNTIYEGRFIVIKSGEAKSGIWNAEERNVLKDYINCFGKAPKYDPILIAILTDSNNTKATHQRIMMI